MPNWVPGYLLANFDTRDSIENDYYSLMSANDSRVVSIRRQHSQFDSLVRKFTDQFGVKIVPSVLMVQDRSGSDLLKVEAAAGFRDAIALSCVCKARALRMIYRVPRHFQFSSWFDFYPWITSIDYSGIIGNSPAVSAWHEANQFRGQTMPGLPFTTLSMSDCDEALLNSLLGEWTRRFITRKDGWRGIALFRSLNMAYAASQLPSGPDMTHYALGRSVGLWISAIEILAHPGKSGQVGYKDIYRLLSEAEWKTEKCKQSGHHAYAGRERTASNTLPCWIYGELFRARNDFLHGNPVAFDRLVTASGHTLYNFAAPLYRMALTGFLGIQPTGPSPPSSDPSAFAKFHSWRHHTLRDQEKMESALAKVLEAPQE
jgi:hypothetical protein